MPCCRPEGSRIDRHLFDGAPASRPIGLRKNVYFLLSSAAIRAKLQETTGKEPFREAVAFVGRPLLVNISVSA